MSALTLYQLEKNLAALLDTQEMVESPEQQEAIAQEIVATMLATVEKRDRVSQFLAHCEHQQESIDKEIERLRTLNASYARTQERVEKAVAHTILSLGVDEKGKHRKLEGRTSVLALRKNPAKVEITDECAVPVLHKTVSVTVSALAWEIGLQSMPGPEREWLLTTVRRSDVAADKRAIKEVLEEGREVPGARLAETSYSLSRR